MGFLDGMLNQKAVYWGSPIFDGFGKLSFDRAIEIDVRWEEQRELFLDSNGKEGVSKAVVYSNKSMCIDSYLYLGTLDDLSAEEKEDPVLETSAFPVKQYKESVDINGSVYVRKVWL